MHLQSFNTLLEKAVRKRKLKKLVISEASDKYALQAIAKAQKSGLIDPVLVGDTNKIVEICKNRCIPIEKKDIVHASTPRESARISVNLIKEGKADLLMKGLISTRTFLKEVINRNTGLSTKGTLSHLAVFDSPYYHKILGLTDSAMNITPDIAKKKIIIKNAVEAFNKLGYTQPKVALLAAIEKINAKMPATVESAKIAEMHKKRQITPCFLEGPLALDLAVSKNAAEHKEIEGHVVGDADILVVPEITSGNVIYKSLTCLGGSGAAGVVLGAQSPIILTSRGDSTESKFYSIALAINLCDD